MSTIRELLEAAVAELRSAGSESPRLDAELLLGHVLGIDRTAVLAHPEAAVGEGQRAAFEAALARRATGEPVAYIRGVKEFYGLAFTVDPRALIPRPETETLVELALAHITGVLTGAPRPAGTPPLHVWDVGTGSGAIAVALAVHLRRRGYSGAVRFSASDCSADALRLALENAVGHGVADAVEFRLADLVDLPPDAFRPIDLLVANLPYIPSDVVPALPIAASYEPRLALDGGLDGLEVVRRLLAELPRVLAPGGAALLEIGADQATGVREAVAERLAGWSLTFHADLTGRPRVAELAGR
ncbi:MAG: peptide chain release factor N(5)-glutamine methyltransferase [Candidatus Limnocylindrales bacterium]